MSGRRAPHLQRRNGIYHLRVRVPDAVRPLIGRSEVRRSFATSSYSEARSLAARHAAKVMEAFEVIVRSQLTVEKARAVVQACFADLQAATSAYGGLVPLTGRPDLERQEQLGLSRERVQALEEQLVACRFDGSVSACAENAARVQGVAMDRLSSTAKLDLLSGVARALIEQQRLFQLRIEDRLACFVPKDILFTTPDLPGAAKTHQPATSLKGLTIADGIDRYLDFGKQQWVLKTYLARVWQLRFFVEHVGSSTPLAAVTSEHIRTFRDAVRTSSNHCQAACDLLLRAINDPSLQPTRDLALEADMDDLAAWLADSGTPLIRRGVAALAIGGGLADGQRHSDAAAVFDVMADIGSFSNIVATCRSAWRLTRNRMALLLPLVWQAWSMEGSAGHVVDDPMPRVQLTSYVPGYALDQFTRAGNAVSRALLTDAPDLRRLLDQSGIRKGEQARMVGDLIFLWEGGRLNRRLVWIEGGKHRLPHRHLPAVSWIGSNLGEALRLVDAKASQIAKLRQGQLLSSNLLSS